MAVATDAATDDISGRGVELRGIIGSGMHGIFAEFEQMQGGKWQMIEHYAAKPGTEAL